MQVCLLSSPYFQVYFRASSRNTQTLLHVLTRAEMKLPEHRRNSGPFESCRYSRTHIRITVSYMRSKRPTSITTLPKVLPDTYSQAAKFHLKFPCFVIRLNSKLKLSASTEKQINPFVTSYHYISITVVQMYSTGIKFSIE